MATKLFSLLIGSLYLFFGVSGCIAVLVFLPPDQIDNYQIHIIGSWGMIYHWMPSNIVHNILYILIGVGGITAALWYPLARFYCMALFWLSLMLAVTGFLPFKINHLWGFIPLFGWNIMFHAVTAIACWYYGFLYPLDLGGKEEVLRTA